MVYDLSVKKRMECERYQDCSWFEPTSKIEPIISKSSLAELSEPFININDFALTMQYTNEQTIPRGEEYLEVFDDAFLAKNYDEVDQEMIKSKFNSTPENFTVIANTTGGDSFDSFDTSYGLRKTDSFDDVECITATNLADILPISLAEYLNNSNCCLTGVNNIKNEIKKEIQLPAEDIKTCLINSDEHDLNIGREEIVEEISPEVKDQLFRPIENDSKLKPLNENLSGPLSTVLNTHNKGKFQNHKPKSESENFDSIDNYKENENFYTPLIKAESVTQDIQQTLNKKLDLNLDTSKGGFEQSIDVNTPDLDFMDLIDYINEDINGVRKNSNDSLPPVKSSISEIITGESTNGKSTLKKEEVVVKASNISNHPDVDHNKSAVKNLVTALSDAADENTTIADRIKIKAKRRVTIKNHKEKESKRGENEIDDFDDCDDKYYDEDYSCGDIDEDEDDYDDDADYDYCGRSIKRRCKSSSKKNKTNSANIDEKPKQAPGIVDSYRERRDKNNEASRRSRQNRKDRERRMYKSLEEEERRNIKLKTESEALEKQVVSLRQLLLQVVMRKADGT